MRTCRHCHLGNLHQRPGTYANWHAGQFVIVPNLPAWQCDVCAACEIDADALSHLLPLLGPVTRQNLAQLSRHQPRTNADQFEDGFDPTQDRRGA
jgi:YgiT-type zinc finger domain-containing protein